MNKAVIVGGGLAGLTAAIELAERGFDITLYEGREELGGKAASLEKNTVYDGNLKPVRGDCIAKRVHSDHGYHVFPLWYVNMRRLWERIGIKPEHVFESGEYYGLQRGSSYDFASPVPKSDRELFSLLDLVTRTDEEVDNLSFRGFLYSRIYNDLDSVSLNQLFLNALSIPEYDISSRVVRNLFRQWMPVIKDKNWAALKGSLGEVLIDRMYEAAKDAAKKSGGKLTLKQHYWLDEIEVDGAGQPILHFVKEKRGGASRGSKAIRESVCGTPIIMALPLDVLRNLQSDALFHAEPAIRGLNYLRANQFGAMDIYFKRKLPNVPLDHFDLIGSTYNLSGFDISEHWPVFKKEKYKGSVMQFVAGSCKPLTGLSIEGFTREMLSEIVQFIPDATADGMDYVVPHRNASQPLFVNDVGTWEHRPPTEGRLFFFAGDYVRHDTDITSMEGAVRSGLNAAEALRQRHAPNTQAVQILPPMGFTDQQLVEMRMSKVTPGRVKMFFEYRLRELLGDL